MFKQFYNKVKNTITTDYTGLSKFERGIVAHPKYITNHSHKIILDNKVYLNILADVNSHSTTETGGVLLGYINNSTIYALDFIDAGYMNVRRTTTLFEYDAKYINHVIRIKSRLYKNKPIFVGLWHRHPGSLDTFSAVDDRLHKEILIDRKYPIISLLVNIDPKFRMSSYLVQYQNNMLIYNKVRDVVVDSLKPELYSSKYFLNQINNQKLKTSVKTKDVDDNRENKPQSSVSQDIIEKYLKYIDIEYLSLFTKYNFEIDMKIHNNSLYLYFENKELFLKKFLTKSNVNNYLKIYFLEKKIRFINYSLNFMYAANISKFTKNEFKEVLNKFIKRLLILLKKENKTLVNNELFVSLFKTLENKGNKDNG